MVKDKNNKLIKRLLNLNEDYKLDLNEGKDDEELCVLHEMEKKDLKTELDGWKLKDVDLIQKLEDSAIEEMQKECKDTIKEYSKKGKQFEKDTWGKVCKEIRTQHANKILASFKEQIRKGLIKSIIEKDDSIGATSEEIRELATDEVNKYFKEHEKEVNKAIAKKISYSKIMDHFKKVINTDFIKKLWDESTSNQDQTSSNQTSPKRSKAEKEIIEKLSGALKYATNENLKYPEESEGDLSVAKTFTKDFSSIKQNTESYNKKVNAYQKDPVLFFQSFKKVLDDWVQYFEISKESEEAEEVSKSLEDSAKEITNLGPEEQDRKLQELQSENLTESEDLSKDPEADKGNTEEGNTEDGGATPPDLNATKEIVDDAKILNDIKKEPAIYGANLNKLSDLLNVLRLLTISDNFPYIGEYFQSCEGLRKDAKDLFTYYLILILNAHFETVFKSNSASDGGTSMTGDIKDPKVAKKLLKEFCLLVNNTSKNPYSKLLQSLISANDILGKADGDMMLIRHCLTATFESIVFMANDDISVKNQEDLIQWRKKDCVTAHKAFDEVLKKELEECFKNVLEKEFTIMKDGQEIKQPIKNYMFDVQIPRRFKKVLNSQNDQFENFIKQYYSEKVIEGKKENSKVLADYFEKVAGDKQDQSIDYMKREASDAEEAVEKDIIESAENFVTKTDIEGDAAEKLKKELVKEELGNETPSNNEDPPSKEKKELEGSGDDQTLQTKEKKG